jgi:uncharacterized cupredoxin-like copper-binding protein
MGSHRFRVILLISVAALVLGTATTAALAVTASGPRGRSFIGSAPSCDPPRLPGTIVNITLADMPGTMMGPRMMGADDQFGPAAGPGQPWPRMRMMSILIDPATVPAGPVSFRVINSGVWIHELDVMPLEARKIPGQRTVGADGRIDESSSLGEVTTCAEYSAGSDIHHITPGGVGWTTITLQPGRYELICNISGHYVAGMYTQLDVNATR